jgi:hypothetical protein
MLINELIDPSPVNIVIGTNPRISGGFVLTEMNEDVVIILGSLFVVIDCYQLEHSAKFL